MKEIYVVFNVPEGDNIEAFDSEILGAFNTYKDAKSNAKRIAIQKEQNYKKEYESINITWHNDNRSYYITSEDTQYIYELESIHIQKVTLK